MALSFLYIAVRRLLGAAFGRLRSENAKDIEMALLHWVGRCASWPDMRSL